VFGLLEGKNVSLKVVEKEDLPLLADWCNNPEFLGDFLYVVNRNPEQSGRRGMTTLPLTPSGSL